jgi:hypothetical protein
MHTHTVRKTNVGYEHRGRLFGHDLPAPGKVHALSMGPGAVRFDRWAGTIFTAVCGERVGAGRAEVEPAAAGRAVTCGRCRAALQAEVDNERAAEPQGPPDCDDTTVPF